MKLIAAPELASDLRPRAANVVAHPDDQTLWCGGYVLTHPEYLWRIVTYAGRQIRTARRGFGRCVVPAASAHGRFTGTPTRGLHARGAGAPGDDIPRAPSWGGITRLAPPDVASRPVARLPRSVAATAGARMGMRAGGGRRVQWPYGKRSDS